MLFKNISNWQSLNSIKKNENSNYLNGASNVSKADNSQGVTNFRSIIESLSDNLKAAAFTSSAIEGHVKYNLKAAFQTNNGDIIDFELNFKLDFKFEQASAAYAKNKKTDVSASDEFSPEKTAKRISDFAMAFLPAFQSNHSGQAKNESLGGFFDLAKDAIAKGFEQAKNILGGLYGETAEKTHDLVKKLMDDAKNILLGADKVSVAPQKKTE
jgi:hypothetical protein